MAKRIGMIGAGVIGHVHLDAARAAGLPLMAIADVNEAVAKQTADEYKLQHAFSDPLALIASTDIDAVIIGVPNKFHAPLAIAALEAGKDVLCEKPMALSVAQCKEMNAAAKANDRLLQIGFMQRFTSVANAARHFIEAGRLGNIYHAKCNYYRRRGIPGLGGWFTTKALSGGGPLIDLGVHIIDLSLHLMGYPTVTRVSGKVYSNFGSPMDKYVFEEMWAGPPRYDGTWDVEDSAHALVRFASGSTLEVNTTWAGNFPDNFPANTVGFFGDKGGLTFELAGDTMRIATEEQGHNVDIIPKLRPCDPFQGQLQAFIEAMDTREITRAGTGEQGQVVQSVIDAIYRSSEADAEVEV